MVERMEGDAADAEKRTDRRLAEDVARGADVDMLADDRQEGEYEIHADGDEEAMLAAAEAAEEEEEDEATLVRGGRGEDHGESKGKEKPNDGLSEGMMAALAKLREQ
jgi:hypothetical protein